MPREFSSTMYTPQMLEYILSCLNEICQIDGTKKYQFDIMNCGSFGISCPITNQVIYPSYNYFHRGQFAVIYIFEGAERLALISSILQSGSPIVAAKTKRVSVEIDEFRRRLDYERLMEIAQAALLDLPQSAQKVNLKLKPILICGSRNFAHFLCNELPAIHSSIPQSKEIEIYLLRDLFNLRMKLPYSRKLAAIEKPDNYWGWNSSLVFTGTSTFLTEKVRSCFLEKITSVKNPIARRIYITVRPNFLVRSLINQVEFLSELVRSFREKYADMEFVLDGFSYPHDLDRSNCSHALRQEYSKRTVHSRLIIRKLIQAVPGANILDITGKNLSDALEFISSCSYYVSHSGTQQHKIAWFFPRNGFVHSNHHSISDSSINALAAPTECSITPSTLEAKFINDAFTVSSRHSREKTAVIDRNKNYVMKNVRAVVNQIMNDYANKAAGKFD